MARITRALMTALAIRRKDRSYGWWGYHQI